MVFGGMDHAEIPKLYLKANQAFNSASELYDIMDFATSTPFGCYNENVILPPHQLIQLNPNSDYSNKNATSSWNVLDMDNTVVNHDLSNDDYFSWSADLKLALNTVKTNQNSSAELATIRPNNDSNDSFSQPSRKRKSNILDDDDDTEIKMRYYNTSEANTIKDPLDPDKDHPPTSQIASSNDSHPKKEHSEGGRMPSWQVDDITDNLAADLDGSLSGLGSELNASYNMSDTLLSLPSLQVFKQEAPSPPNHENINSSSNRMQQSPTSTNQSLHNQVSSALRVDSNTTNNPSLHHLLNTYSTNSIPNPAIINNVPSSQASDHFTRGIVSSSDCSDDNRFQYVLAAATSIATKINEDTLTYLNQGQSYEIKLKKLGDLSNCKGKTFKSVIGICFHERRMQYGERERLSQWQNGRPGDRVLEVDVPLSYGFSGLQQPALNSVTFNWDPTIPVGVYIKVNCISTEFTPKKHGGEKGVPFRIQIETYDTSLPGPSPPGFGKRLHAAACQIKVFKLKGADRKHKQDRDKIMKRPLCEQEKYQPSYDCTVLNDISYDNIYPALVGTTSPISPVTTVAQPSNPRSSNSFLANNVVVQTFVKDEEVQTSSTCAAVALPLSPNLASSVQDLKPHQFNNVDGSANTQRFLTTSSSAEETVVWLTSNRFSAYLSTFASFSGADLLRLSRDDLIQICGLADGIRLFNALHSKVIAPKLTIYVCIEQSAMFHALYLNSLTTPEFGSKLTSVLRSNSNDFRNIQGYFIQGPNGIHIHINDDVIQNLKNEAMFTVELISSTDLGYRVLLKPFNV